MIRAKRTFVILTLALAGCRGAVAPAHPTPGTASIRLLAEESTAPLLRDLAAAYRPANTLVAWQIQTVEWNALDNLLATGAAPYALTHFPASDRTLWSTPVGQDSLALVVNSGNTIASLSPAQLRSILTGRTLNWKEIGGPDLQIQIVARQDASADTMLLRQFVLGERLLSGAALLAPSSSRLVDLVSENKGALGYISMRYLGSENVRPVAIDGQVPSPETVSNQSYPLRTPLLFVGREAPGNDAYREFFAWVQSPAGQAVVARSYGALQPQR